MGNRKKLGGNLPKGNKGGRKIAAAAPSPAPPISPVAIFIEKYNLFGVHIKVPLYISNWFILFQGVSSSF
jgi:hypothetical protein